MDPEEVTTLPVVSGPPPPIVGPLPTTLYLSDWDELMETAGENWSTIFQQRIDDGTYDSVTEVSLPAYSLKKDVLNEIYKNNK